VRADACWRAHPHEIPKVIRGLILRLEMLVEERKEEVKAKITFRTLYRLMFAEKGGRPKYLGFNWGKAQVFVEMYKGACAPGNLTRCMALKNS
jgi:hypothetical protein